MAANRENFFQVGLKWCGVGPGWNRAQTQGRFDPIDRYAGIYAPSPYRFARNASKMGPGRGNQVFGRGRSATIALPGHLTVFYDFQRGCAAIVPRRRYASIFGPRPAELHRATTARTGR